MIRQYIISALLCSSLAGCNVEHADAKLQAHRPADGFAAFAQACITPNGTKEHSKTIFAKYRVAPVIPRSREGRLPGGRFEVKNEDTARYWPKLHDRFATTCVVRIQGLWANFDNDMIAKRLAEQGFRKVNSIPRDKLSYREGQSDFRLSPISGGYRHRQGKYDLILAQSIQPGGLVTDLIFGNLE